MPTVQIADVLRLIGKIAESEDIGKTSEGDVLSEAELVGPNVRGAIYAKVKHCVERQPRALDESEVYRLVVKPIHAPNTTSP